VSTLFLDLDGCLNTDAFLAALPKPRGLLRVEDVDCSSHIDPARVVHLNRIVQETGCRVVLSSSWRHMFGVDATLLALRARGYVGEIHDRTPKLSVSPNPRWKEIAAWLQMNPDHGEFVVIDDFEDAGVGFGARFLHCTKGLTDELAERAVLMLGRRAT